MTAQHKVLVVDDDPVVHKSFDRVLSGKGYAVITAADGEEALRKLSEEAYDVVYTDIRMPGMDGLEVAERVKAQQPWTPVVIITGYGSAAAEARAEAAGVTSFLHKPLTPEMIEGSAQTALAATAAPAAAAAAPVEMAEAAEAGPERAGAAEAAKNILLFLAAPFIALAYVIALPFVGIGILAVLAVKAMAKSRKAATVGLALKQTGLFIAAPFIALVFVIALPFVGLAMLAWTGGSAWLGAGPRE